MDTRVKANEVVTPEVSRYLEARLASLEKLLGEDAALARIEVEVGRDAGRPRHGANIWFAEMAVLIPGHKRLYARNNSQSVNGAIDDVKEEIERQLLRERKIHIRLLRKSGSIAKRILRFGRE